MEKRGGPSLFSTVKSPKKENAKKTKHVGEKEGVRTKNVREPR